MSMRVLRRYMVFSVLRTGIITAFLATFILMGVDLFANLDAYMSHSVPFTRAMVLTTYYAPEAFLLAVGPSFLFSVSYHLSMMSAGNEMLIVLDSGVSYMRLIRPLIILGIFLAGAHFAFNELVAIPMSNQKAVLTENITDASSSSDNRNIALSDMQSGYMVYAASYSDENLTLHDLTLIESDSNNALVRRTDAFRAVYDTKTGLWTFYDLFIYTPTADGVTVTVEDAQVNQVMRLEPQLFRNVTNEISKMSLGLASSYLKRMKTLNPEEYASLATEYYKRIFSCLTSLVMIIIACSVNYRFKKNVLFFSLVGSICIAVVYYVVQMVTIMLADQGVIAPQLGTLIPFFVIIVLSSLLRLLTSKQ